MSDEIKETRLSAKALVPTKATLSNLGRVHSKAKSDVALSRKREGGKFVAADPEKAKELEEKKSKKEKDLAKLEELKTLIEKAEFITDEDREYIGTDSGRFFERAMMRAPTFYEGLKYAKELKPIQHASLQAVASTQEVTVTQKVLRWQWAAPETQTYADAAFEAREPLFSLEGDVAGAEATEEKETDGTIHRHPVHTDTSADGSPSESEEV